MQDIPANNWGIDFSRLAVYERNLPHWRQEGAVYFVTFRTADSIPRYVLEAWYAGKRDWLTSNGIDPDSPAADLEKQLAAIPANVRLEFERDQARRLFSTLDACHGACPLQSEDVARVVGGAMQHFHGDRLLCGDFVVMPNHVHWIVVPQSEHKLEDILHSVKRYSAGGVNKLLGRTGKLWQKESFDRIVRDAEELVRTRAYIHENPAKAGLRDREYVYHRADW